MNKEKKWIKWCFDFQFEKLIMILNVSQVKLIQNIILYGKGIKCGISDKQELRHGLRAYGGFISRSECGDLDCRVFLITPVPYTIFFAITPEKERFEC